MLVVPPFLDVSGASGDGLHEVDASRLTTPRWSGWMDFVVFSCLVSSSHWGLLCSSPRRWNPRQWNPRWWDPLGLKDTFSCSTFVEKHLILFHFKHFFQKKFYQSRDLIFSASTQPDIRTTTWIVNFFLTQNKSLLFKYDNNTSIDESLLNILLSIDILHLIAQKCLTYSIFMYVVHWTSSTIPWYLRLVSSEKVLEKLLSEAFFVELL